MAERGLWNFRLSHLHFAAGKELDKVTERFYIIVCSKGYLDAFLSFEVAEWRLKSE